LTNTSYGSWIEIGRYDRRAEAEDHALALTALGIASRLIPQERGIGLFVTAAEALRARRELVEYARENRRPPPPALRPAAEGLNAALAYGAVLVVMHVAAGRQLFGVDWWSAGFAEAGRIVGGEWWRTLTALGLHADVGHLAGNLVAGGLFGLLLAQSLGPGLAWLAILSAGGVGNALNALIHPAAHTAVGASTAVFAALGLIAALMLRHQASLWSRGLRRWLPLAAGVTLLAFLGVGGERTDVGAHVAGFSTGVAFGAGLSLAGPLVPQGPAAQRAFGAVALALFCLAWFAALGSA
jgi:membrane associated rhomboid family serine protease